MEANTTRLIWKKPFGNADDLSDLLVGAAIDVDIAMDEISVDICGDGDRCKEKTGIAVFEAEALSDASIVYNITLH